MLSLTLILFAYLYPEIRRLVLHWSRPIFASLLSKYNRNVFVHNGRRRCEKYRLMPTLYARAFATSNDHRKDSFLWDTYGIPFVIDKSVNNTIFSQCILFTGLLVPTSVILDTEEGLTTTTKIVGSMKLIITDDANKNHSYVVPHCVFDSNTPVNILGVPSLGTLFGDNADATNPLADNGATIKVVAKKSHFIWYHGWH